MTIPRHPRQPIATLIWVILVKYNQIIENICEDIDDLVDLSIAVDKLTTEQMHEVNKCALHYGLGRQDFMSLLTRDLDEQESLRIAKEEEQERAMYSVIL
jgi:arginine/serine-rich splicing factor 16